MMAYQGKLHTSLTLVLPYFLDYFPRLLLIQPSTRAKTIRGQELVEGIK